MPLTASFYCFAALPDCAALVEPLRALCAAQDVRGNILLAPEGINGSIAGQAEAVQQVLDHLRGRTPVLPVHSMVDRRRRLHADALRAEPDWPVIPMASDAESAAADQAPIGAFAPRSAAALAFAEVWRVVERRLAA